MNTVNLIVPSCWQELSPKQLKYVYFLLANNYTEAEVKTLCLCRWSGLEILSPAGSGFHARLGYQTFHITSTQIVELLSKLNWLASYPLVPVRFPVLHQQAAVPADLQGVPFENYLALENYYQGYLVTKNLAIFDDTTELLYGKHFSLQPEEQVSIFYWLASVKQHFAKRWPDFFKAASPEQHSDMQAYLQDLMDTQIRALTKGDISKEEQILQMDVHRALTELNAQAKEYEELKKQMKS